MDSDTTHQAEVIAASVRKFQKELNAGTVSLVLLTLVAGTSGPVYGYQIAKELEAVSGEGLQIKQGTLYPVLRSLEASGLLSSHVEPSVSGPPRRYYRITDPGHQALAVWKSTWVGTRDFIDGVLEGHLG